MAESVKVVVRCRPMNAREEKLECKYCISCDESRNSVTIFHPHDKENTTKSFTFDGAYFIKSTTKQIYEDVGFALVDGVLEGYNGTVFAYGQTGCGKSFSMQGITDPPEQEGIIPRSFEHIFEEIDASEQDVKYLVQASYLEIYNEEIRDLLGKDIKQKLELRENPDIGVYTQGLSQHIVKSMSGCIKLMEKGWSNRSVGATLMNNDSSRSHSIFSIRIEMSTQTNNDEEKIKVGKLNLVDLAGSERQSKTGATGDRLKEATKINLSLSALGNVISALVDGKSKHIPYRDSKLTRLLQDSLGGNTKTMMIACISPADNNYDETMSTLRYANRAKNIKNKPKINEDPKDALIREYADEIKRLKAMLEGKDYVPPVVDKKASRHEASKTELIKQEYEEKISSLKAQYEEEQVSRKKLDDELTKLKTKYERRMSIAEKSAEITADMAVVSAVTLPTEDGDEKVDSLSAELQNIPDTEIGPYNIQLTMEQAATLTSKQLLNLYLTPFQEQKVGKLEDGMASAAQLVSLSLSPAQVVHMDLSEEQLSRFSPYQRAILKTIDEQCEALAKQQISDYLKLFKSTKRIKLTRDQAYQLTPQQISQIVLDKDQLKDIHEPTDKGIKPEMLSEVYLLPSQLALLCLTPKQVESLDEEQAEAYGKVMKLVERQELFCALSDSHIYDLPTVKLTSAQATQLNAEKVKTMELTDAQTTILRQYKDAFTEPVLSDISDMDQIPLLPHQIKHLNVLEDCTLDKGQKKKVTAAVDTQTNLENLAVNNLLEMEESLTKMINLTDEELAIIKPEQFEKVDVSLSPREEDKHHHVSSIALHDMQLTEEQKQAIKSKKIKRMEKHARILRKLKRQAAALISISTEGAVPEPCLKLTSEQVAMVQGRVVPTKQQQEQYGIEAGRCLDPEDMVNIPLSKEQIGQIQIHQSALSPEQKRSYNEARLITAKQDILKRLKSNMPLNDVSLNLLEHQAEFILTNDQINNIELTPAQCEILGLVPGQTITVQDISLLSLNGEQILQLKLNSNQISQLGKDQKFAVSYVKTVALDEYGYLNSVEEEGILQLSKAQCSKLSSEQLMKLTLTPNQLGLLGITKDDAVTDEHLSKIRFTGNQLKHLDLTLEQQENLDPSQREIFSQHCSHSNRSELLREVLRLSGLLQFKRLSQQKRPAYARRDSRRSISLKAVYLTAEQAKQLTPDQLHQLVLTTEQLETLGVEQSAVSKLTPSQLASIPLTKDQITSLNLEPFQLKTVSNLDLLRKADLKPIQSLDVVTEEEAPGFHTAPAEAEEEVMQMQQEALLKLQELESNTVKGGELIASDEEDTPEKVSLERKKAIREKMSRRRAAAQRRAELKRAMEEGDDEKIVEELFNIQVEEVEVRARKIEKIKQMYKDKEAEIRDLTTEFQTERTDYLDQLRIESQQQKLLMQLLDQVQPLIRRDCNYSNLDHIKKEAKWDEVEQEWVLPKVTLSSTKIPTLGEGSRVSINTKVAVPDRRYSEHDDSVIRQKLCNASDVPDYFKSTRQQKIIDDTRKQIHHFSGTKRGSRLDPMPSQKKKSDSRSPSPVLPKKNGRFNRLDPL